jgi:hypothetical protein
MPTHQIGREIDGYKVPSTYITNFLQVLYVFWELVLEEGRCRDKEHFPLYYGKHCFNSWDLVFCQMFLHMFMSMRLYCYELLLSLMLFDETSLFQIFLSIFVTIYCGKKSFVHRLWWKEHSQRIHLDVIERDVWSTNLEMLDKWYIQIHEISFFMFKSLVQQITPFITHSFIFVWKSHPICKVVKIVL